MAENKLTDQQLKAITEPGRVIVSASAGSGKTFVMIERLADLIAGGGDLDGVLAVTFTKKAAAQMKEKLRLALIKRIASTKDETLRARLKEQLGKIASANISTIHSFCGYLLRVYFYILDIDGSFEIISEDGGAEKSLRDRAMDTLFDRLYEKSDENLAYLLARYSKGRSDEQLKTLVSRAYDALRNYPDYAEMLARTSETYGEDGFDAICDEILADIKARCDCLRRELDEFMLSFPAADKQIYAAAADRMRSALDEAGARKDLFAPLPELSVRLTSRGMTEEDKALHSVFIEMRDYIKSRYAKLDEDLLDRQTELEAFKESGRTAEAFAALTEAFDAEYARIKREEGKLDYGDLEHLTLKLLQDESMLKEVRGRFPYVFVDEYQDVNPVQEKIISAVGGENLFLVGDVKQAIYGFRGSKSVYFTRKVEQFGKEGKSLVLTRNFRSSPAVVNSVNAMFCKLMRDDTCGINYARDSVMTVGAAYPEGSGGAFVHYFGKDGKVETAADGVYSVAAEEINKTPPSREGLAVAAIVRRELGEKIFDLDAGTYRAVEPGDICVLTRKRDNSSAAGIYRALIAAGFPVSGAQGGNVCDFPEVKQLKDILSFIDNGEQDIPLASAMLSPAGGFTEEELALIKIAFRSEKKKTFRECCFDYSEKYKNEIAEKIKCFYAKIKDYRRISSLFGAGTLIDRILRDTGLEARYMQDGGKKLRNVRRFAEAAYVSGGELSLTAFLQKIEASGMNVPSCESGGADSIKIMTMHSSKGLEFPVVILADVMRPFRGRNDGELPLDEKFCFAHKHFDVERRVSSPTVLGRLCRLKAAREDVKNEMNLLYVACTRAKFRLHVLSRERTAFNPYRVASAADYAHMLDMSALSETETPCADLSEGSGAQILISSPDEEMLAEIRSRFRREYAFRDSIDLPVKSSASAILRMQDESYYAENVLYADEDGEAAAAGETGAERGTAYHRYLQLCDFSVTDEKGIAESIEKFKSRGLMTDEQAKLLNPASVKEILSMQCFQRVCGAKVYREQEFLCSLPACEFLDTASRDGVLVQGAIDLLCIKDGICSIIDYKYSKKSDEQIKTYYKRQLDLYRLAAEKILGFPRGEISASVINIFSLREIRM